MPTNQAAEYIERFERDGRLRLQPRNARREIDHTLPHVRFYRFPDGSMIRSNVVTKEYDIA